MYTVPIQKTTKSTDKRYLQEKNKRGEKKREKEHPSFSLKQYCN